jgi:uncharacterized glyoxalase superfamily protein PhnB
MLRRGAVYLMLNSLHDPDEVPPLAPDPQRAAGHEDTGLYFGCPEVDALYEALAAKGLALDPPKDAPYGMRQLVLRDPDGFVLCFQRPVRPNGAPK